MHPALRRTSLLLALALTSACAGARPAAQPAAPAEPRAFLWEATRPGSQPVYLLGSVHVGKPGQYVFAPSVEAAFARADTLVVEVTPEGASSPELQQLTLELGLYTPPDSLVAHVSPETRAALPQGLQSSGLSLEQAQRLRPWLLALMLGLMDMQRAGYAPEGGVEHLLLERAKTAGKAVRELETAEGQVRMFAGLPDAVQDRMLREQLEDTGRAREQFGQMLAAWERGDAEALAELVFEEADDPAMKPLYEAMFYTRNRAMADGVAALAAEPRTHLVVVGAGHMVGPQGLPALLAERGFQVRQLPRTAP